MFQQAGARHFVPLDRAVVAEVHVNYVDDNHYDVMAGHHPWMYPPMVSDNYIIIQ